MGAKLGVLKRTHGCALPHGNRPHRAGDRRDARRRRARSGRGDRLARRGPAGPWREGLAAVTMAAGRPGNARVNVSQISHRLTGQHRTRADRLDHCQTLSCGYGLQSTGRTGGTDLRIRRLRRGAWLRDEHRRSPWLRWPDHPATIATRGKPSRPGPQRQGRSAAGCLHLDPVGLARSPARRVDGDGMTSQA